MPNGETVYSMFGALGAASSLTVIVHEVLTLADNGSVRLMPTKTF
jgi:uncharacterized protein YjfI (DUF2170 family)